MSVTTFYNCISPFYPFIDLFLRKHKKLLIQEVNQLPQGTLLELGVGHANHLKHYNKHSVIAIDSSEKMLEQAKKKNNSEVEFHLMNAEQLKFPNQFFDYVVLSHLLSVSKNPNKVIKEAERVLKEKGKLIILNHFTPKSPIAAIDYLFQPIAKKLHFNSYFKLKQVSALQHFQLKKELRLGLFKQYKLLVLNKEFKQNKN